MIPSRAVPIRAIILDLDGTLYSHQFVRAHMLKQLAHAFLRAPRQQYRVARFLQAYRRAQETLRKFDGSEAGAQLALACQWTGADPDWGGRVVHEWMEQRPLQFLASAARPGLTAFLAAARRRGIRMGLCSDYPPDRKLRALGIEDAFDAVVSAQDPAVNRFKPHPASLLATLSALGVPSECAVYVGDRPEVDGEAAQRAGIRGYILCSSPRPPAGEWVGVRNFDELSQQLGMGDL